MSKITKLSSLARLQLTTDEVERFSTQLDPIFEYMNVLNEVDTADVEPTSQVTGLTNVMREDEIERGFATKDELLGQSPLPIDRDQIRVKKVL